MYALAGLATPPSQKVLSPNITSFSMRNGSTDIKTYTLQVENICLWYCSSTQTQIYEIVSHRKTAQNC